jgi:hypothetical protein
VGNTAAALRKSTSLSDFILSSSPREDSNLARSRERGIEKVDGVEVIAWQSTAEPVLELIDKVSS